VAGTPVDQVMVGSCTNGAYEDVLPVAKMLEGREVAKWTDLVVAPGSKQAAEMLTRDGWSAELMAAGANLSEATCGACIGAGHVPASDSVSLRTFNRNFRGRSGNEDDAVYLCSPEVAAAAALAGEIVDPRDLADELGDLEAPGFEMPDQYVGANETDLVSPDRAVDDEPIKGPEYDEVPLKPPLSASLTGPALIKVDDDITTDHIIPGTPEASSLRANIPKLSKHTLARVDDEFSERAAAADGGFIVAGENYGQGSSREHAALCPMYLGVHAVLGRSFARIHETNLFNFGLLPLTIDADTYERIEEGDDIEIVDDVAAAVASGREAFTVRVNDDWEATARLEANEREREMLVEGGKLPHTKNRLSTA
jgi:aconitate hydratase